MNKLAGLSKLGQSVWLDYIRRFTISSGELSELIEAGVRGVTSNPTIFEKAIAGSSDYDGHIASLAGRGASVEEIYEELVLKDITDACDLLRPVYESTGRADGYVSLEVDPGLALETQGTIDEATRLFTAVGRPNLMIKVPATREGMPAIEELIAEGINVNATLIFSLKSYEEVARAYISGLMRYSDAGGDPSNIGSVASFFVSRVDTAVDRELERTGDEDLMGTIAVANAKVAYARFKEIFSGGPWERLVEAGARVQRPLWASTGTKNPSYSDVLYVDELIGPDTVNTLPPATLNAFIDHGVVEPTLELGVEDARDKIARLPEKGVDLAAVTDRLLDEGVKAFAKSFESIMAAIDEKRERLSAGRLIYSAELGPHREAVDTALGKIAEGRVVARIWEHDHTVWRQDPAEIANRLGWLEAPETMKEALGPIEELVDRVRADGYTHALLLGMGGSSLAPEVMRRTFGVKEGYLDLAVLDSTDPAAVLSHARRLDPSKTLFIVSSKSGTTVESLSFFKYFYNKVLEAAGAASAGDHFIAITDPGSKLARTAENLGFRKTFLNDPNIGGRFSALSYFGLVPAALIGADARRLLDRAATMARYCGGGPTPDEYNLASRLGAAMGALALAGRDKLTLIASRAPAGFGDWVEQLIAESTGKDGRGILPVVGEEPGPPEIYGDDRTFVQIKSKDDRSRDAAADALREAGHPVMVASLADEYDLGGQFFLWEMATAVAGYLLEVHPFDQPNVEEAKALAREMMSVFVERGALPDDEPAVLNPATLEEFLSKAKRGDYIAIHAYLAPNPRTDSALNALRLKLRDKYRLATTVGYGPRFLHSTGQLHKGDAGRGLFVQFTSDDLADIPIPDEPGSDRSSVTFGVLKTFQAAGDRRALQQAGRRVIRFHLGRDVAEDILKLTPRTA